MFAGTKGWVLKPPEYRGTAWFAKEPSLKGLDNIGDTHRRTLNLSVEVYAGQAIPLPTGHAHAKGFRPYVSCQLHSIHAKDKDQDTSNGGSPKYKQRTKTSSGTDPDFGGQVLQFPSAPGILEELSFLR